MSLRRRGYTGDAQDENVSEGMKALRGIETYIRGMLDEVYHDLGSAPNGLYRTRLQAKKEAYQDVLQYIKEGQGIL